MLDNGRCRAGKRYRTVIHTQVQMTDISSDAYSADSKFSRTASKNEAREESKMTRFANKSRSTMKVRGPRPMPILALCCRWLTTGTPPLFQNLCRPALSLSLLLGLVCAQYAHSQTPGTWNPAGNMSVVRGTPTAILLQNGTVLVVGGASSAASDLYDPVGNAWSTVGSMSTGRNYQAGTILSDGRVLIAGGIDPNNVVLATAEIYDPSTQTWTPTGNLNTPRYMHSATLLPNGMVLVAGGWPGPGPCCGSGTYALISSELWDPATGTWTATGNLPSPYASRSCCPVQSAVGWTVTLKCKMRRRSWANTRNT